MKPRLLVFITILGIVDIALVAGYTVPSGGSIFGWIPLSDTVRLNSISSSSADWTFEYVIIDDNPLATDHMGDCEIVDINGDSKPDLWFSGDAGSAEAYQMAWYKNPSWERFKISRGNHFGGNWGDIDGDGDLDLAVSQDYGSKRFVWLENTGNPEQADWPKHQISDQFDADVVHFADLNEDGRLDIVVMAFRNDVYYLPGPPDPKGVWTTYNVSHSSEARTSGSLADIDQDGDLDILWGNGWLENPGDPTQIPWVDYMIDPSWPAEAQGAVADFDGDGSLEVVLSGEESDAGVAWYRAPANPKTETWTKMNVVSSGYQGVHSLALADFDGDGALDIFAAEMHQGTDPDKITIFENVDIASNTWTEHIIGTTGLHNAKVGDVNGDGYPDIVGKNWRGDQYPLRAEMWVNRIGSGKLSLDNWQRHVVDPNKPWRTMFITSADMDSDGEEDIITGGWWYQNPGSPGGTWIRNTIGWPFNNMAAVYDFDGDGNMDVLGTQGQGSNANANLAWARNNGLGSFTILTNISAGVGDFLQGVAVDRFQAGNLTVALSWHSEDTIQMLTVPSSPSSETWAWRILYDHGESTKDIDVSDIDKDGDVDIFFVGDSQNTDLKWLRNDGNSWSAFTLSTAGPWSHRTRLADISGDGRLDAVIGFYIDNPGYLAWYEQGSSATSIWTENIIASASEVRGPMSLDMADMDNDGDTDVVVGEHNLSDPSSARLFVYENVDGQGDSWTKHLVYTGDEHHQGAQVVDIDGDGDLDIISIGWGHDRVLLYENKAIGGDEPLTVAAPTITPNGGTFTHPASITLATSTSGASIYYTTDGSEPITTSTLYSGAFMLTNGATVKARAFRSGYNSSNVASASFIINTTGLRVTDGQQVLYTFREGSGTTVYDVSGTGTPLNLGIENGTAAGWLPGRGLVINSSTIVSSVSAATKVINASQDTNEITIEAWIKPASATQDGPARIVTLSLDPSNRNFTLGQGLWDSQPSALYDNRLRTTTTDKNGEPSLTTPDGSLTTELTHVVYTRDASGVAKIYVNGVEQASVTIGGDFSNWDGNFRLALANELTGDRPWLGEFHLVAIFNRALSQAEVSQNFNAGLTTTITPVLWLHLIPQKWQ